MELKHLQLLRPKDFRERFAPNLSEAVCRDIFHIEGFPMVTINGRLYTTAEAASRWLACMGRDDLFLQGGDDNAA
jgi:hypothetical protein